MRNHDTYAFGDEIQALWEAFSGTKEEFMDSIPGVTLDQRAEPAGQYDWLPVQNKTYYYCTVIKGGRIVEVYSYDNDRWWAKY